MKRIGAMGLAAVLLLACAPAHADGSAAPVPAFSAKLLGEHVGAWEKGDTELNPGGAVVDAGLQDVRAALKASPSLAWGAAKAHAEAWALIGDNGRSHEDVLISEAVLALAAHPSFRASLGMRNFSWGSAYSWNPSNPFGDRNANNTDRLPAYRRRGSAFSQAELTASAYTVTILGVEGEGKRAEAGDENPLEEQAGRALHFFGHADYAARVELFFDRVDAGFTTARYRDSPFLGLSASSTVSERLALHAEGAFVRRYRIPLPEAVDLPAGSGYILAETRRELGWQGVWGGQYTTASQVDVLVEYLYNGAGFSRSDFNRLRQAAAAGRAGLDTPLSALHAGFLGSANALPGFFRRHYAFARLAFQQLPGQAKAALFSRLGLEEAGDAMVGGSFSLPLPGNLDFKAYGEWFPEGDGTEAGLIPIGFYSSTALVMSF